MKYFVELLGCYDIKNGDRIECEDVKLFFNNFILTTEDGVYHTFQIKRRDEIDGITIAQTVTRRFYLRVSK